MTDERERAGERVPIPIGAGTIAGIAAWLIGYLGTSLATLDLVREDFRTIGLELVVGEAVDWQVVGWLFYNAHGVDTRIPAIGWFQAGTTNHDFLADAGGSYQALYLLPAIALVVAGALVARRYRRFHRTRTDAAIAGATTVVGYLLCAVLGLVAFAIGIEGETLRPDPITAVLLAGLAYPIVFGGLGGVLVSLLSGGSDEDAAHSKTEVTPKAEFETETTSESESETRTASESESETETASESDAEPGTDTA